MVFGFILFVGLVVGWVPVVVVLVMEVVYGFCFVDFGSWWVIDWRLGCWVRFDVEVEYMGCVILYDFLYYVGWEVVYYFFGYLFCVGLGGVGVGVVGFEGDVVDFDFV